MFAFSPHWKACSRPQAHPKNWSGKITNLRLHFTNDTVPLDPSGVSLSAAELSGAYQLKLGIGPINADRYLRFEKGVGIRNVP
jgi:hypothetical protein